MSGKIVAVRLWRSNGRPLLADIQPFEQEPYRRRLVGFLPEQERTKAYEYMDWRRDERPSDESESEEEAEGVQVDLEEEEEEEDES